MLNRQGRPSSVGEAGSAVHPTFTGNKALAQIEPLIFEIGQHETTGVDLDEPEAFTPRLGGLERKDAIGLPGLSEPETMRHYVRLSQMNYGIDTGLFPLGSCTMKHNARLNERWRGCRASPTCIRCSRSRPFAAPSRSWTSCRAIWSRSPTPRRLRYRRKPAPMASFAA